MRTSHSVTPRPDKRDLNVRFAVGLTIPVLLFAALQMWDQPAPDNPVASMNAPRSSSFEEEFAHPLEDGEPASEEEAQGRTPYRIPTPSHSSANRQNLRSYFTDDRDRVAMTFSSGVLVKVARSTIADPEAEFRGLIESGSLPNGRIEYVHGHPALVTEPGTDLVGQNPASLQVILDGISVTIYHPDMTGDDLLELARSIR